MAILIERQAQRLLTEAEWSELEELIREYGQLLHEHQLRRRARRRGVPVEEERQATDEALAAALADWHASGFEVQQQALAEQGTTVPER